MVAIQQNDQNACAGNSATAFYKVTIKYYKVTEEDTTTHESDDDNANTGI